MPRIEEQIEIEAGATEVFRFCHDVDRRAEWDQRVARAQMLSRPPMRRGTLLRFDTRPAKGAVFTWDAEIVEYHFPSGSKLQVVDVAPSGTFSGASETWRLASSGGTTRFTLVWAYVPRGIVGRLLDAV
ncbi:MAG: SRPBCC family protein, partial [Armatimonadota bacterium]